MRLLVIAKSPVAGRSKTRLCPPCSPEQAATLAEAALRDTLAAVAATPCAGRTLVLDGPRGDWIPPGFDVIPQRGEGLGQRLAEAFSDQRGPSLLIGMDTPQVHPELLGSSIQQLQQPDTDAVLGLAEDGGFWALGMRQADPRAFDGVPMSSSDTGAAQLRRLEQLGLRVTALPVLRDVDRIDDAHHVAALRSDGQFARAVSELEPALV